MNDPGPGGAELDVTVVFRLHLRTNTPTTLANPHLQQQRQDPEAKDAR